MKKKIIVAISIIILIPIVVKLASMYHDYDIDQKKNKIIDSTKKYLKDNPTIDTKLQKGHCYISTKTLYDNDYIAYENSHDNNGKIISLYLYYDLNDNIITYSEENIDGLTECTK